MGTLNIDSLVEGQALVFKNNDDGTNYDGVSMVWASDVFTISVVEAGSGTVKHIVFDQPETDGGVAVVSLDQGHDDETFIDFVGTSAADSTKSLSSDSTEDAAKTGAIKVDINGVAAWIRVYADAS